MRDINNNTYVIHNINTPTSTTLDRSNNKMSDNRNIDEVNMEMDDIFLLQWIATVGARPPPAIHVGITIG